VVDCKEFPGLYLSGGKLTNIMVIVEDQKSPVRDHHQLSNFSLLIGHRIFIE
jgi:hypothetical protein